MVHYAENEDYCGWAGAQSGFISLTCEDQHFDPQLLLDTEFYTMQVNNPKAIGEISEGIILAHLIRRNYVILIPFGNNQRYDLVVDIGNGSFIRGQCKTGVYRCGCVKFSTCSTSGKRRRDYRNQIEVFWVYCPELDKVYQIPVNDVGINSALLRVDPPIGGATSHIRWAKDYEIV